MATAGASAAFGSFEGLAARARIFLVVGVVPVRAAREWACLADGTAFAGVLEGIVELGPSESRVDSSEPNQNSWSLSTTPNRATTRRISASNSLRRGCGWSRATRARELTIRLEVSSDMIR